MENQHRKIAGYRELTQHEIDLMNEIKAFGPQLQALIRKVEDHLLAQEELAYANADNAEYDRLALVEPRRWASIGETDLQRGMMALTRAVAQPTFF